MSVLLLLIYCLLLFPLFVLCLVLVFVILYFMSFKFCNRLDGEHRAGPITPEMRRKIRSKYEPHIKAKTGSNRLRTKSQKNA